MPVELLLWGRQLPCGGKGNCHQKEKSRLVLWGKIHFPHASAPSHPVAAQKKAERTKKCIKQNVLNLLLLIWLLNI